MISIKTLSLITLTAPLLGSLLAGFIGKILGKTRTSMATIFLMTLSFLSAIFIFKEAVIHAHTFNGIIYTWGLSGHFEFDIGFLIDSLTATMMLIVTFVSLLVHIYSVGYMAHDEGYQRFFSYVSLFTFAMLLLLMANNFFQLYVGWESVGLVSYLLIGFWFQKESAAQGSLKAFIVNRVGDFGFILAIAAILDYFGTVNFQPVFDHAPALLNTTIVIAGHAHWSVITVICVLLFIGAMGKSAQVPLHVWLPESMEGPTPISALIHAATMVTAGVYLVARMSPLFELSSVALSLVLVVGATGALFLGLLAFVENDIKRVIAYSTMSQLGYMMAADGVSAFSAGIFHLVTHACFKALLFLAAGSVIIAMHHEQDLRKMGNLKKYLPLTCMTFFVGACALSAIPPFAGYFSKDAIIEAVHVSTIPGATYAYWCLLIGAFVTSFYIFRAYFMAFHTKEKMDNALRLQLKETPWSMRLPLILLAIPSALLGILLVKPMLFATPSLLANSVMVSPQYDVLAILGQTFHGWFSMMWHCLHTLPFWFAISGVVVAYCLVVLFPRIPVMLQRYFNLLYKTLVGQYGFDLFNRVFFVKGSQLLSQFFYRKGDLDLIDNQLVNGSGRSIARLAGLIKRGQTGYLYHYVLVMILGVLGFLLWQIL